MDYGQPPSWRPDVDQIRAEAYRGTVRDALWGLRNLEQLLGSLRVGPRALTSVLPDVCASCVPLAESIDGLAGLISSKLPGAEPIAQEIRQLIHLRLEGFASVLAAIEQQTLNAKHRLRLEEAVSEATRDVESVVELIDMLGEAGWGRVMPLRVSEVLREAYRSSDPPSSLQPAVRLVLVNANEPGECIANPRALVLMLHHLARWSVAQVPSMVPAVELRQDTRQSLELHVHEASASGEARWAPGRRVLPLTGDALKAAAQAMHFDLQLGAERGEALLGFPPATAQVP
jgi:hypothetical protein